MEFFNLPAQAKVGRVVPKNAFDAHTNTKQKKLFTDCVQRITWTHKLSPDTVNLTAKEVAEIQVFKIALKQRSDITKLLEVIDKAVPYAIVFWVEHEGQAYLSAASKHPHPLNEDRSVVDWRFTSDWFLVEASPYALRLAVSLDAVLKDLCLQIVGRPDLSDRPMREILEHQQTVAHLRHEIERLKSAISKSKQFKEKVALNLRLRELEGELGGYG